MQEKTYAVLTELMGLLGGGSPLLYDHDHIIAWGSVILGSFGELYWGCASASPESQKRRWGSEGNTCNQVSPERREWKSEISERVKVDLDISRKMQGSLGYTIPYRIKAFKYWHLLGGYTKKKATWLWVWKYIHVNIYTCVNIYTHTQNNSYFLNNFSNNLVVWFSLCPILFCSFGFRDRVPYVLQTGLKLPALLFYSLDYQLHMG